MYTNQLQIIHNKCGGAQLVRQALSFYTDIDSYMYGMGDPVWQNPCYGGRAGKEKPTELNEQKE
jgi:hypothetical protein